MMFDLTIDTTGHVTTRSHFSDIFEQCTIVEVPATFDETPDVPFRLPSQRKERFRFSGDQKPARLRSVKERLDTVSVPGSNEQLLLLVIETESELTPQMLKHVKAISLVQRNHDLRVALARELIADLSGKMGLDIVKAVQFSVDDSMELAIRAMKRLMATWT